MHVLCVVHVEVGGQLCGISSLFTFIWLWDETQVLGLLRGNHFSPFIH